MEHKVIHFLYCPLLGLGLYGGHRGKRWLRNRIKIFKQFVVPSLLNQTSKNFVLWVSVRYEDRSDILVADFRFYLENLARDNGFKVVFTYCGVCFWDDKYPDEEAHSRLINSVHSSMPELLNFIGDTPYVLLTIQPSDDCYYGKMVEEVQRCFAEDDSIQAVAYKRGYVMDYKTREVKEWNPNTNPPFYTIRFAREVFTDPLKHIEYAGIKSHEYLDALKVLPLYDRGFLVGTHGENISTVFNHPFAAPLGRYIQKFDVLYDFGLQDVPPLVISVSWRKALMKKLPHGWQRKLRYWLGERFYARFYNFIRS